MTKEKLLTCPKCESERVTLTAETSYMANTGDYFCQSVKTHDADSKATCLDCWWEGEHFQLVGYGEQA